MPRIVSRSIVAIVIASVVGVGTTGCSAASSVVECSVSSAPPKVAAPIDNVASALQTLSGVTTATAAFDQPQAGACESAEGSENLSWESSLNVRMLPGSSASQVNAVASLAAHQVHGEVALSIVIPADDGQAKTVLMLTEGTGAGAAGPLTTILAAAKSIGRVAHVQAVTIDPGLEPAVPGATTISLSEPSATVPALDAAHKTILTDDSLSIACGDRLQLTTENGEPTSSVIHTLVAIAGSEPGVRISNMVGTQSQSIFVETPTKAVASTVATRLSSPTLTAASSAPKVSFTIVAANPTTTVKGWVGSARAVAPGSTHRIP